MEKRKDHIMHKKILALCLSVILAASALSACSKDKSSSEEKSSLESSDSVVESTESESTGAEKAPNPSLTVNGKKVDTDGLVMFTIEGNDITFDEFRYNYYYFMSAYASSYGVTDEEMSKLSDTERSERFSAFKESLIQFMKGTYAYMQYAKDNNIELTEDEIKECEEEIKSLKEEQGDDYEDYLKDGYLTEDYLLKLIKQSKLADKVRETFKLTDDEFLKICKNDLYQVRTILIPYGYDLTPSDDYLAEMGVSDFSALSNDKKMSLLIYAYSSLSDDEKTEQEEKAASHAEDIAEKAKNGEDFEKLLQEYGFDGGMNTYSGGYVVADFYTSYGEEFANALKNLNVGEISDSFEFSYGYQIIKRVELDTEYIKENLESDTDDTTSFKEEYQTENEYKTLQDFMDTMNVDETDIIKNLEYGDLT